MHNSALDISWGNANWLIRAAHRESRNEQHWKYCTKSCFPRSTAPCILQLSLAKVILMKLVVSCLVILAVVTAVPAGARQLRQAITTDLPGSYPGPCSTSAIGGTGLSGCSRAGGTGAESVEPIGGSDRSGGRTANRGGIGFGGRSGSNDGGVGTGNGGIGGSDGGNDGGVAGRRLTQIVYPGSSSAGESSLNAGTNSAASSAGIAVTADDGDAPGCATSNRGPTLGANGISTDAGSTTGCSTGNDNARRNRANTSFNNGPSGDSGSSGAASG